MCVYIDTSSPDYTEVYNPDLIHGNVTVKAEVHTDKGTVGLTIQKEYSFLFLILVYH